MTLDRRHMAVALAMLAGSVVYNVSVLSNPAPTGMPAPPAAERPAFAPEAPADRARALAADASAGAPDVVLSRTPVWRRDPFARHEPPPAAPAAPAAPVAPAGPAAWAEPEIVVNSVLYSSTRRLAMVNGRTARIGDQVGGGATIVDIQPDGVTVRTAAGAVRTIARLTAARGTNKP